MNTTPSQTSRNGRMSFGSTASMLLERARATSQSNRRPTPDSEAMVSSDEEHGNSHHPSQTIRRASGSRPTSSWLSDIGHPQPARKFSLGNFSVGSSGSQPPTPSSENTPRLPGNMQGNHQSNFQGSLPGGPQGNIQGRSNAPIGFQSSIWTSDRKEPPSRLAEVSHSPTSFGPGGDFQAAPSPGYGIGVEIPLNPVFKPGQPRAMSFSAGSGQAANDHIIRLRSGITRKNSAGGLGQGLQSLSQVREDEDDVASNDNDSDAGVRLPSHIKADPNHDHKMWSSRPRTGSSANLPPRTTLGRSQTFSASELAVDEDENALTAERFQTTLWHQQKYGQGLQSRRHSLAVDFPRQESYSIAPHEEERSEPALHSPSLVQPLAQVPVDQSQEIVLPGRQDTDLGYFYGNGPYMRLSQAADEGRIAPLQRHVLYFVLFKCFRGGVYYVVEGTGLDLRTGDMVIVEGDRGIDIGTIQHCDITPAQAKNLMVKAQIEHFRWLMMFSRTVQTNPQVRWAVSSSVDPQQAAQRHPSHFHHGEESKPKLIKRLAQAHEVQTLKDKEGAEAKAKRLCQQKVVEHGLQMEILDAELQMDNRKLTFYYFAEAYVNFNELVTDLFKIYKTRIWMSAVNPASFASIGGVQPPSALGQPGVTMSPGAMGGNPSQVPVPGVGLGPSFGGNREDYAGFGGYRPPTTQTSPTATYATALYPTQQGSPQNPTPNMSPWAQGPANARPSFPFNPYGQFPPGGAPAVGQWSTSFPGTPTASLPTAGPSAAPSYPRTGTTPQNGGAAWYGAFANMHISEGQR